MQVKAISLNILSFLNAFSQFIGLKWLEKRIVKKRKGELMAICKKYPNSIFMKRIFRIHRCITFEEEFSILAWEAFQFDIGRKVFVFINIISSESFPEVAFLFSYKDIELVTDF